MPFKISLRLVLITKGSIAFLKHDGKKLKEGFTQRHLVWIIVSLGGCIKI